MTKNARSIAGFFFEQAERFGDRTFLRCYVAGQWQVVKWREAAEAIRRIADALAEAGVVPGDSVALISGNRAEWILCDLAILTVGGVTVPVYPNTQPAAVHHILENSGAVLAIAGDEELAGKVRDVGAVRRVALMDREVATWIDEQPPLPWDRFDQIQSVVRRDDVATIVYTSGTTGMPKGVRLAHRNFLDMAASALAAFEVGPDDVVLSVLPYSHVFERVNSVFVAIAAGATIWVSRGLDQVREDIAAAQPTIMCGVPRLFEKVRERVLEAATASPVRRRLFRWAVAAGRRRLPVEHQLANRLVLAGVRRRISGGHLRFFVSGGAPLGIDVERFFWDLGIRILQGWGMTELCSGATSNTESAHRYGTVGRPLPGVELRIEDDGEIVVRSPGSMLGYNGDPAATAATLSDGWVLTGDIGETDADGFLRITDRKKDLIKTAGGKYVAPLPIEAKLMEDRLIEWAVVVGDSRPYVTALIVPDWQNLVAAGIRGDPEQLAQSPHVRALVQPIVDRVNAGLERWETLKTFAILPRSFTIERDELTPTLKPKRRVIERQYADVVDSLYEERETRAGAVLS